MPDTCCNWNIRETFLIIYLGWRGGGTQKWGLTWECLEHFFRMMIRKGGGGGFSPLPPHFATEPTLLEEMCNGQDGEGFLLFLLVELFLNKIMLGSMWWWWWRWRWRWWWWWWWRWWWWEWWLGSCSLGIFGFQFGILILSNVVTLLQYWYGNGCTCICI